QKLSVLLAYSNLFLYYVSPNSLSYLDESINIFRKSLFFPISFSSIYTGLAITYYEKKINERALSMINKALNIKPYDPISLEYYGKINNSLGNYSQTINKLRSYTNIKYPDMIYQLAIAYEKTDKIDEAIDTYLLVYKYDPYLIGQGFISLIRVGDVYLNIKKDKEKAISYYQEVLKILPDSLVAKQKIEEANKK
ncbi:MAG: tetratricopeptide repeat protein, partial [bacterium]